MLIAHLLATKQEEPTGERSRGPGYRRSHCSASFAGSNYAAAAVRRSRMVVSDRLGFVFRGKYDACKSQRCRRLGTYLIEKNCPDLEDVASGEFDFDTLEHLLLGSAPFSEDED